MDSFNLALRSEIIPLEHLLTIACFVDVRKEKAIMYFRINLEVTISREESDKRFYSHVNKPQLGVKLMLKIDPHLCLSNWIKMSKSDIYVPIYHIYVLISWVTNYSLILARNCSRNL